MARTEAIVQLQQRYAGDPDWARIERLLQSEHLAALDDDDWDLIVSLVERGRPVLQLHPLGDRLARQPGSRGHLRLVEPDTRAAIFGQTGT